ncbi:hypothetical protein HY837_06915 [archaeon]|nr:hypothetical protein [archaeon]
MGLIGNPKFVKKIEELAVGEQGYIHPGALAFDESSNPFLYLNAPVVPFKTQKIFLPVKRTGQGENDYDIMIPLGMQHCWKPSNTYFEQWGEDVDTSKIVQLSYDGENSVDAKLRKMRAERKAKRETAQGIKELETWLGTQ